MLVGLRKPEELIVIVVTLLAYGCPVQAIVHALKVDERTVARWQERAGRHCQRLHEDQVMAGKLDLQHVQADEIRGKGWKMIPWIGLCAVSASMKFLRNAGEGESKASRTPNLPGVETQRGKEHVGEAENSRRYVWGCSASPVCMVKLANCRTLVPV
jgi:hypothetical protein